VGGNAVNDLGQENRNIAKVPTGTTKIDMNEVLNN